MEAEATIINKESKRITIQVSIPLCDDMLSSEDAILQGVNLMGLLATEYALSGFDTDGTSIEVENKKYTSKGQLSKTYQCQFGEFELYRHVYQSNDGGSTYCPLDDHGRILVTSTPRFAKIVSQKYSNSTCRQVQRDLEENHGRFISRTFIQDISDAVGNIASSKPWEYTTDIEPDAVSSVAFSLDGTCMLLRNDGWRQAMVGSICLYDHQGERLHTTYIAQPPEHGKETFLRDFEKEINKTKKIYQGKTYVGIADGAKENWTFLQNFTDMKVLDFFHATEYLAKAANVFFKSKFERKEWIKKSSHTLKHEHDGAYILLKEMKNMMKKNKSKTGKEDIETSITYFSNHLHQMHYWSYLAQNIPIGSGVIEAACKVIIKQRMCNSGMRWTEDGAKNVLVLRCFNETDGKWTRFWDKIRKWGY
jgi:hypothetical protein